MNKHYIRVDENSFVIKAFSDAFEQPIEGDICVDVDCCRHYNLDLYREDGLPKLKYVDGEIVETVDGDLVNELQVVAEKNRLAEILTELKKIDKKRFRFIDGDMTTEEYETYRLEAIALRAEYHGLE